MDYLAGMNMNLGCSLAVEKLCGMKMPEKAQVIRVIIAELNRIASHLVGMGAYGLDLGTFSPFLYAFREREMILDLFEEVCGARLTYSYLTIGGATTTCPTAGCEQCQQFLDYFEPRIPEYHTLLTTNQIFVKRTADIGVLSKEMALDYGCTGPMLRGSLDRTKGDPDWDLRKIEPYCGYETYDFDVIIPPFADGAAGSGARRLLAPLLRAHARSGREHQARASRRSNATRRPQGSHRIEPPRAPAGRAKRYLETECPRGQMGFYVVGRPAKDARAAARAGPVVELLQPERHQRALPRLPDRRRAGHRRLHRHRHGRDRSVSGVRLLCAGVGTIVLLTVPVSADSSPPPGIKPIPVITVIEVAEPFPDYVFFECHVSTPDERDYGWNTTLRKAEANHPRPFSPLSEIDLAPGKPVRFSAGRGTQYEVYAVPRGPWAAFRTGESCSPPLQARRPGDGLAPLQSDRGSPVRRPAV